MGEVEVFFSNYSGGFGVRRFVFPMASLFHAKRSQFMEFFRFGVVGGISFLADFGSLFVLRETVLSGSLTELYIATVLAFLVGLAVNTVLAVKFVFRDAEVVASGRGKTPKDLFRILIIGIIGMTLTTFGMYVGVELLLWNYLLTKIVVTLIVMFWNYFARKIWVFN